MLILLNSKNQLSIVGGQMWKKLIEANVRADNLWRGLAEKRKWSVFRFYWNRRITLQNFLDLVILSPFLAIRRFENSLIPIVNYAFF